MIRLAIVTAILLMCAACGGAPAPTRVKAEPFTIISERPDPAGTELAISLKLSEPVTQSSVKSIVESVISNRKERYRSVIVKSYLASASAADIPYAVSRLEGGTITHQFNSEAAPQRIPTH